MMVPRYIVVHPCRSLSLPSTPGAYPRWSGAPAGQAQQTPPHHPGPPFPALRTALVSLLTLQPTRSPTLALPRTASSSGRSRVCARPGGTGGGLSLSLAAPPGITFGPPELAVEKGLAAMPPRCVCVPARRATYQQHAPQAGLLAGWLLSTCIHRITSSRPHREILVVWRAVTGSVCALPIPRSVM